MAAMIVLTMLASPLAAQQTQPPPPPPRPAPAQPQRPPPQAKPPAPQPDPAAKKYDGKIFGLPRVGDEGVTAAEVELLQRAARKFIDDGRCGRVDYGDRSQSRPGWYVISCEGRNILFTRDDIEK